MLVAAGTICLSGAFCSEVLGAVALDAVDDGDVSPYVLANTVEELLEMLGVTVFLCAVISYRTPACPPAVPGRVRRERWTSQWFRQ